jgi:chromosome segregation protein
VFLKTLTLKGFKSFAETTVIDLEPGVAVIVGPNGSGKSNVVDAIAWVLGAQAPSSVRSTKMDDVIFAGTQGRPALGRAEVGLTIDNSAGLLPMDFTEVTISRTLFRNGDSEYAINGVPARLLDIQDLLSDSGVGRQQHVIVSQGQIDAVLNAKPEERRLIIEEAAGVLKYRRRKEKAERRLGSTHENLLRLQDLIREVRRQLRPLERQADAARRHGAVVGELTALRVHVAGREIDTLRARLTRAGDERRSLSVEERELKARLAELDNQVLRAEAELSSTGDTELGDALVEFESLREKARGQLAVLAERKRGVDRDRETFVDQGVVATLESESAQVTEQLAQVDRSLADLDPELHELEQLEHSVTADRERFGQTVPHEVMPRQGTLDLAQAAASDPTASSRDLAEPVMHDAAIDPALVEARNTAEGRQRRAAEALDAAERMRRDAESAHQTWSAREEALALALEQANTRAGADQLRAVEGVMGSLLDVVEIDEGCEAAFEAAVGEYLSSVVVDGHDAGRRAVQALRDGDLPGLILPTVSASSAPTAPPVGEPLRRRVRGRRPEVDSLLDQLLAKVVLLDGGWSAAIDAATRYPTAIVVTRGGDRFGADGWRIGLTTGQATAASLDEASERARAAIEQINEADRQVSVAQLELEEANRAVEEALRALRRAAEHVDGRIRARASSVGERRSELDRRRAMLDERRQILDRRLREIEQRLEQKDDERQSVQSQRLAIEHRKGVVVALEAYVEQRVVQIGLVLDDLRERRRQQSEASKVITTTLKQLRAERGEAERVLTEVREKAQRAEIDEAETRLRLETAVEALRTELEIEPDEAVATLCPEVPEGVTPKGRIRELERELRLMGPINPLALQEYEALQERHQFLQDQLDDVKSTRRDLNKVIREIDREIVNVFTAAYADVSANFTQLFETLFPGGSGRLKLTDPENLLDTGIEVEAKPSGKNVRKLSLLSGGERSLTALAYLFAVFRSRPSPFYVMDEVEAALDDVNLHRFLDLVHEFREEAQLLIVSHQKRTMEAADCLFGVTMKPGGSSRIISEQVTGFDPEAELRDRV